MTLCEENKMGCYYMSTCNTRERCNKTTGMLLLLLPRFAFAPEDNYNDREFLALTLLPLSSVLVSHKNVK